MANKTAPEEQMELRLKQFDKTNTQAGRDEQPRLQCTLKTGVFRMNKYYVQKAKANAGNHVVLLQDEETRSDWYLCFGSKDGFPLRGSKENLTFNSCPLVKAIFDSVDFTEPAGSMLVGEPFKHSDGRTLFPLLASTLSYRARITKA